MQALRDHRVRQVDDRLGAGAARRDTDLIFATRQGGLLEPGNVVRSFERVLERAGLPSMRFHDLRHSCATLLLVQGVAPRVVMEILGHSQISLTMDTYTSVIPALQDAAAKLDELIAGKRRESPRRRRQGGGGRPRGRPMGKLCGGQSRVGPSEWPSGTSSGVAGGPAG